MPRDLVTVLDAILPLLEPGSNLRVRLVHVRESAAYTAPEAMSFCWLECARHIEAWVNELDAVTRPKVLAGSTDRDLRQHSGENATNEFRGTP